MKRTSALTVMAFMLLESKLVALRRRMTSLMRGCSHRPVPFGVCTVSCFCGVLFADDLEGVRLSVGRFAEEFEVVVVNGDELVLVSAVEDMLAFVLCCGG